MKSPLVPGIESSCDETGAGLVREGRPLVRDPARDPIVHLGDTVDDAAGECFDKVARVFGLLQRPWPTY